MKTKLTQLTTGSSQDEALNLSSHLKRLTSDELLLSTKNVVSDERQATVSLISHLEEIQSRRLFAEIGFSSLWDFCTKYLQMSEGSAQRRIQAMRLVKDLPSEKKERAKAVIASGQLSVVNAAAIQSFLGAEKKNGAPQTNPIDLIEQACGLSQRDLQAKLLEISPECRRSESEKIISAKKEHQLKFVVSDEVFQKLQRIRGLLAHKLPSASLADLTAYFATQVLAQLEKKKAMTERGGSLKAKSGLQGSPQKPDQNRAIESKSVESSGVLAATKMSSNPVLPGLITAEDPIESAATAPVTATVAVKFGESSYVPFSSVKAQTRGKRVYLPVGLRRKVFERSRGSCEYSHQGHRCTSIYALEIDHRVPLALNGANDFENLRVLCRAHNLQQAQKKLGEKSGEKLGRRW